MDTELRALLTAYVAEFRATYRIEYVEPWQREFILEIEQWLEAEKAKRPGMKQGYKFGNVLCPDCQQLIKRNWIIPHRRSGCMVANPRNR